MTSGDSPAVARRRVRLAVREAREQAHLTQGEVAEAMEWSLSKVMRIESGEVTISPNDLRPLLNYLGVTDRTAVEQFVNEARTSRRLQLWWDDPSLREYLTPSLRQLIQFEADATAIRSFCTTLIPGRLQTAEYAQAVFNSFRNVLSDEDIAVRLKARYRRREEFLGRRDYPDVLILLDESVLQREVGGSEVMGHQLMDLLKLAKEKRVLMRVVRFTDAAVIAVLGAYEILNLGDDEDAILYREVGTTDVIVEDPTTIKRHRDTFEQLWYLSLDEPSSASLIEERAQKALASVRSPNG